ncbi:MAG: phosphatidylglycerol lysyltransferase domain-containing protein [Oscillospiraceae bacterium]
MIHFKPIEIDDFEKANDIFKKYNIENCDHCFATMVVWSYRHPVEIAIEENTVFMRTQGPHTSWYLSPTGEMPLKEAIQLLIEDGRADGHKVKIFALDKAQKDILEGDFPNQFAVELDRDAADYIYSSEDLRTLPGKNYQKKRNHCSRFVRDFPDYKFHLITKENIEIAKQFELDWCARYNCDEARGLFAEQKGIMALLNNYDRMDLVGAMIETGGEIVAMSIAAPLNERMVDVIVEKAYHDVNGAYAIINRDFAINCFEKFQFINREDDMGEENLRKAKLSYFPYEIRDKYLAKYID